MVAEIKIIAPSFYTKNIDGNNNISKYAAGEKVAITEDHLSSVNMREGSLLKDFLRLKSIEDKSIEKYMILVIPRYEESNINTELEKALCSISLSGRVWERRYPNDHFDLRIWLVD